MISSAFFASNRENLIEHIDGSVAVITAYTAVQRGADMEQPFLQEANFYYLTGITEPNWLLIIDGLRHKSWLVAPHLDDVHRIFNGGLSHEDVKFQSGIDAIVDAEDAERLLRDIAKHHNLVYTLSDDPQAVHYDFALNPAQKELGQMLKRIFNDVRDCRKELAKLRAVKQPVELEAMQRAVDLTVKTFKEVRQRFDEFHAEYEIDAHFTYRFRQANATHAYQPIVASGIRGCTLHHVDNGAKFSARDMVVMDIGAAVDGYAADVTRTYCQNPTKRQKIVHSAVKNAQEAIIDLIEPGLLVTDYMTKSDLIMKKALSEVGLLSDMNDADTYHKYFPHAVSHGLGIDVHDSLGAPRYFEPGMVLTVEPGIYIPEERIGVRIEDDILVTSSGRKNLSGSLSTELD